MLLLGFINFVRSFADKQTQTTAIKFKSFLKIDQKNLISSLITP